MVKDNDVIIKIFKILKKKKKFRQNESNVIQTSENDGSDVAN